MPSTDAPVFRAAGPADRAALLELMREFYAEEHLAFDELRTPAALDALLAAPALGHVVLIAPTAGQPPAGYLALTFGYSLEFHGRFALLDEFYLRSDFRGRGWGRRALDHAAALARKHDATCLRLELNHANLRARAVYLRSGFTDDHRDLLTRSL